MTPFKLDGEEYADEFKITAKVIACPLGHGPENEQCAPKCDRYEKLPWYSHPKDAVTTSPQSRRRRRDTIKEQAETQIEPETKTIKVYHPCKFVSKDVDMCFTDDNGQPGKGPLCLEFYAK